LAGRAAAEVAAGDEDPRARCLRLVQLEAWILPPVEEQELAVAGALDPLQELLGHDLVGVDVRAVEHGDATRDATDRLHATASSSSRTSTNRPSSAAAAAIAGLTRCVRPPLPCRPSKLRFEVEAQRSP